MVFFHRLTQKNIAPERQVEQVRSVRRAYSSTMDMLPMEMVFYSSTATPLFASRWTPSSTGSYAGTCIFLIVLAIIFQSLFAGKCLLERYWLIKRPFDRVTSTHGTYSDAEMVKRDREEVKPWRLSTELPRAIYVTITAGVSYLL